MNEYSPKKNGGGGERLGETYGTRHFIPRAGSRVGKRGVKGGLPHFIHAVLQRLSHFMAAKVCLLKGAFEFNEMEETHFIATLS